MYSRAHLLIEKDQQSLLADDLWGIEAHPLSDDSIFTWTAKIHGLKQTVWEGGIFRLYVKFDEHYKYRPPLVCFHTIPFHPNIDPITGRPCLDFLDDPDQWHDSFTISYILAAVQNLLSNPVLTSAVNTEAIDMIIKSPTAYQQIVLDCVLASQRVEAGLEPRLPARTQLSTSQTQDPHHPPAVTLLNNQSVQKVSFDDYHKIWSGIATSKPRSNIVNPFVDLLESNPALDRVHCSLPVDDVQAYMAKQLESHNNLMYGKFDNRKQNKEAEQQQAKLAKIEKMRKIYLPTKRDQESPRLDSSRRVTAVSTSMKSRDTTDLLDREADELLAWTDQLNVEDL